MQLDTSLVKVPGILIRQPDYRLLALLVIAIVAIGVAAFIAYRHWQRIRRAG